MERAKRSSYRTWLKGFLALFFGLLMSIALFNALVDGVGVLKLNTGLKYMASSLIKGKMVAGPMGSQDERELQRLIVEEYPGRRDMAVIGSSRVMLMRKDFIHGNIDFINHSVSGAGVEDCVAILGLYKAKGVLPKMVVLGIDPWAFNKKNGLGESWKTLDTYYREMAAEIDRTLQGKKGNNNSDTKVRTGSDRLARYKQLINLDYTIQNWECLRRGKRIYVTDRVDVDNFVREPDGSLHFPYRQRYAIMKDDLPNGMPDMYFKEFDSLNGTETFEGLVRYLQSRGVRVIFLLPPFHPAVYRSCFDNPKYGITLRIETYLRGVAERNHITVVGSYDPTPYGFKGADFFDGTHGHEVVMKRLFENFR